MTLADYRPTTDVPSDEVLLDAFLSWVMDSGIEPYAHQEEAFLELFAGQHVLLKTPTGSGKSLVALAMHFREWAHGRRSVYTAPIKALVSEKFFALCEIFGPEHVGLATGDGSVNLDAPIVCCTAEILAQQVLRQAKHTPFAGVVMDEFHYYGDRDRGMAWQLPLLWMHEARFLLMSATLGDTSAIEADLEARTGVAVSVVRTASRPVPLSYVYSEIPVEQRLQRLVSSGEAPVYAVHFTQRAATERAQALLSTDFCTREEKEALKGALKGFRFDSPFGPTLRRMLMHGVAVHHAGLLPKYRMLVEKLSQQGFFKVICGTDTLGVGINVPIRSVLFTQLCKFDGEKVDLLSVRDFQQIAGRAGRKGFDEHGTVVAQAPDWVIENARLQRAIEDGRKKRNKVVKKTAPTRGYKHWDAQTFERLHGGRPEALNSGFRVDHGTVLRVLQRCQDTLEDPLEVMDELIETSHATRRQKAELPVLARQLLDELVQAGVVADSGEDHVPRYRVESDLQDDFSVNHALSLYLLHAVEQIPLDHPMYAMHVVSLVEAVLEHPRAVLAAQTRKARTEALAQLKAEGVPYEERQEALEGISYARPLAELLYADVEAWRAQKPWLPPDPIRPKSIARDMYETQATFSTWVKVLQLERSEGVLLRYLSQFYKTLSQNIPTERLTPELQEVVGFFGAMLARVDDSLVTAWEDMLNPSEPTESGVIDISSDPGSFRARVRAELYALLRALASEDWDEAAACVRQTPGAWDADAFKAATQPYLEDRGPIVLDARGRQGNLSIMQLREPWLWDVQQVFFDEDEDDSETAVWSIRGVVDLRDNRNPQGALVEVVAIGE